MRRAIVACAIALTATIARGEQRDRSFSLQASPDADCPALESFSRRVLVRTSRARLTSESADVAFTLSVERDDQGASGTLEVTEGGVHSVRKVRGASCEEVVDALALIAAVTLDPNASTASIPDQKTAPPAKPADPARTEPVRASSPRPVRTAPLATRSSERAELRRSWRFGGGVRGSMLQGLAPDPVFALGAFLSARLPSDRSSFEPLLLLGVWLARSGEYDASSSAGEHLGTAQFRWLASDIVGCPLRFPVSGEFALRPCVGFEAGRLTGKGRAARNSAEESATWLALTGNVRLDWMLFDRLELDLTAGGFLPLARDDFFFEPAPGSGREGVVVHEIPAAGMRGSIGLGVVFP